LVLYANFLIMFGCIYGGQFPQLEEQFVPGSTCTSNLPLATDNYLSWDSNSSGEGRVVSKRDDLTPRPRRPPFYIDTCIYRTARDTSMDHEAIPKAQVCPWLFRLFIHSTNHINSWA